MIGRKVIRELHAWAVKHQQTESEAYQSLFNDLVRQLEELPIHDNPIPEKWVMGFVLSGGEWWPMHLLNYAKNGWAEWRIDYPDGSCDCGISQPFTWADCSADNRPCINVEGSAI